MGITSSKHLLQHADMLIPSKLTKRGTDDISNGFGAQEAVCCWCCLEEEFVDGHNQHQVACWRCAGAHITALPPYLTPQVLLTSIAAFFRTELHWCTIVTQN